MDKSTKGLEPASKRLCMGLDQENPRSSSQSPNGTTGSSKEEMIPKKASTSSEEDSHDFSTDHPTPIERTTIAAPDQSTFTTNNDQSPSWHSDQSTLADTDEDHPSPRIRNRPNLHIPLPAEQKTTPTQISQPLTHYMLPRSQRQHFIDETKVSQNMNQTYELEQHTKRNQHVLGLKYIHDRYGHPRRPVLQPKTLPDYIDETSGYHNLDGAIRGPPPGLHAPEGRIACTERVVKSALCQYRLHRLRRSRRELVGEEW